MLFFATIHAASLDLQPTCKITAIAKDSYLWDIVEVVKRLTYRGTLLSFKPSKLLAASVSALCRTSWGSCEPFVCWLPETKFSWLTSRTQGPWQAGSSHSGMYWGSRLSSSGIDCKCPFHSCGISSPCRVSVVAKWLSLGHSFLLPRATLQMVLYKFCSCWLSLRWL